MLTLAWPLSRLIRNRPEDYGQWPDGIEPESDAATEPNYTWTEALSSGRFWLITMAEASTVLAYGVAMFLWALWMDDAGYSSMATAGTLGLINFMAIVFQLVGGILGDRIPLRRVMFAVALLQLAGLTILPLAQTLLMFYLSGALLGAAAGANTPLKAAVRGVYFGRSNFAAITGTAIPIVRVVALAGPVCAGHAFEVTSGDFRLILAVTAACSAVGPLLYAMLPAPRLSPSQQRQTPTRKTW